MTIAPRMTVLSKSDRTRCFNFKLYSVVAFVSLKVQAEVSGSGESVLDVTLLAEERFLRDSAGESILE